MADVSYTCQGCRVAFTRPSWRPAARFCSHVCYLASPRSEIQKQRMSEAHKGSKKPWVKGNGGVTKGRRATEAQAEGLRVGWEAARARTGIPRPDLRGANSVHWKGGTSDARTAAMGKVEYRNWRRGVFERDNFTCQLCGIRGGDMNADHILPWATYPDARYDLANGRTLCVPCHRTTDTYGRNADPAGKKAMREWQVKS